RPRSQPVERVHTEKYRNKETREAEQLQRCIRHVRAGHADEVRWLRVEVRILTDVERWIVRIERDQAQPKQNRDAQNKQSDEFVGTPMLGRDEIGGPLCRRHRRFDCSPIAKTSTIYRGYAYRKPRQNAINNTRPRAMR